MSRVCGCVERGYGFRMITGRVDLGSLSGTKDGVRDRVLRSAMGLEIDACDELAKQSEWERILQHGQLVRVIVVVDDFWEEGSCGFEYQRVYAGDDTSLDADARQT